MVSREFVAAPPPPVASASRPRGERGSQSSQVGKVVVLAALVGGVWLGVLPLLTAPTPAPTTASVTEFSAGRAMQHLRVIAAEPHPMGSAPHQEVEHYLLNQLTALGLQTDVQETTSVRLLSEYGQPDIVVGGRVRNVVGRLHGFASTGAILLSGTYDAMPTTPGAADNGAGVATILETVRALRAGPPLANDLVVLLGDAETNGLIGESAFASDHPWANDVKLAVSFGAMGTHGPALPASTSLKSGRLINILTTSPHPLVYTWGPELARQTGMGGAALEYIQRGATTIMLISVAGWQANHTAIDNLQNIDPGGLQQNGEYALTLARTFGHQDLTQLTAPDLVAVTVAPYQVIQYPTGWSVPLALLTVAVLGCVLVVGWRRDQLTIRGVLGSAVVFAVLVIASTALTTIGWWAIRSLNTNHAVFIAGTFGITWYFAGFAALTTALFIATCGRLGKGIGTPNLAAGALVWWAALASLASMSFPSLGALFTWPLLAAALLLLWTMARPGAGTGGWSLTFALAFGALPALVLLTPLVYVLLPLTDKVSAMRGLPLLGVPVFLVALACGLLIPQLLFLTSAVERHRWTVPASIVAAGLLLAAAGWAESGFSTSQPRPDYLAYVLDSDAAQAHWVSVADRPDAWTPTFSLPAIPSSEPVSSPAPITSPTVCLVQYSHQHGL